MIRQILTHYQSQDQTLSLCHKRMMAYILLSYSAFLRCEEAIKIRRSHISIHTTYMSVFIEAGKTDKYREGRTILVARTRTNLDPVLHMYRYLQQADIPPKCTKYNFRPVRPGRKGATPHLTTEDRHVSYTTMKDLLKASLADMGLNPKAYGTHSLRSGSATAAANNDVSDRLFKKHGRWRMDDSKDRYVKESLANRLKVSKNLGL